MAPCLSPAERRSTGSALARVIVPREARVGAPRISYRRVGMAAHTREDHPQPMALDRNTAGAQMTECSSRHRSCALISIDGWRAFRLSTGQASTSLAPHTPLDGHKKPQMHPRTFGTPWGYPSLTLGCLRPSGGLLFTAGLGRLRLSKQ